MLAGRDTLAVMSTGSGKSAIYQIAGLLSPGATVVVSPLIALQRDQVEDLAERAAGGAAQLNSHISASERERALAELAEDALEFLFLAPEQLANPEVLAELAVARAVAARRRRGALHLRVGPRLPPRLPAPRRRRGGARAPDDPRPHRDRRAAGARRDRRAARDCASPDRHPRLRPPEHPPRRSSASTARAARSASCARSPSGSRPPSRPGSSTSPRGARPRSSPASLCGDGAARGVLPRGHEEPRARRRPGALHGRRPRRRVRDDRVRDGHRQGRRPLGLPRRDLRVARRLLPGDRPRRPRRRRRPRRCSSTAARTSGCAASSPAPATSRSTRSPRCWTPSREHDGPVEPASCRRRPSSRRPSSRRAISRLEEAGAVEVLPSGEVAARRRRAGAARGRPGGRRGRGEAPQLRPLARGHDARLRRDRRLPARVRARRTSASRSSRRAATATTAWTAAPRPRRRTSMPFAVGSRVAHGQWGEGVVQRYDDDAVVVLFDEVGYKTLALDVVARARAARAGVKALGARPAAGAELARDRPRRLGDGGDDALGRARAAAARAVSPTTADRADGVAGVVGDRRRDARLARARPRRARARRPARAPPRARRAAPSPSSVRLVELRQRLGEQLVDDRLGRVGEHRLAERARVRGQLGADLEHLEGGVGAEDVVDDRDRGAVQHADADGLRRCAVASRSACTSERARSSLRSR